MASLSSVVPAPERRTRLLLQRADRRHLPAGHPPRPPWQGLHRQSPSVNIERGLMSPTTEVLIEEAVSWAREQASLNVRDKRDNRTHLLDRRP